jgi:hypothetical protein
MYGGGILNPDDKAFKDGEFCNRWTKIWNLQLPGTQGRRHWSALMRRDLSRGDARRREYRGSSGLAACLATGSAARGTGTGSPRGKDKDGLL